LSLMREILPFTLSFLMSGTLSNPCNMHIETSWGLTNNLQSS
jgi:hypothetical protein